MSSAAAAAEASTRAATTGSTSINSVAAVSVIAADKCHRPPFSSPSVGRRRALSPAPAQDGRRSAQQWAAISSRLRPLAACCLLVVSALLLLAHSYDRNTTGPEAAAAPQTATSSNQARHGGLERGLRQPVSLCWSTLAETPRRSTCPSSNND